MGIVDLGGWRLEVGCSERGCRDWMGRRRWGGCMYMNVV